MTTPGEYYADSRIRLTALLRGLSDDEAERSVQACPGWRVHDVVAHLVSNIEDANAGRITGPPTEEQTADQVARRADQPLGEMLDEWDETGPGFEEVLTAFEIWPATMDVINHEHDIRTALDRPGARDTEAVRFAGRRMIEQFEAPVPLAADFGDEVVRSRRPDGEGAAGSSVDELVVRTTPFEVMRLRLGRRTPDQVRALDWSADPSPLLGRLFIFGPAAEPLVE